METRFLTYSAVKGNRKKAKRIKQGSRERNEMKKEKRREESIKRKKKEE